MVTNDRYMYEIITNQGGAPRVSPQIFEWGAWDGKLAMEAKIDLAFIVS